MGYDAAGVFNMFRSGADASLQWIATVSPYQTARTASRLYRVRPER